MSEQPKKNYSKRPAFDARESELDLGDLKESVQMLRDSHHQAAERPDFFWKRQHNSIMAKLRDSGFSSRRQKVLLWASTAAMVFLCMFFFAESNKTPMIDIAGGADQELLINIERALSRDCPNALAPAKLITQEMEQAGKNASGH
jgi:hypothetical protein